MEVFEIYIKTTPERLWEAITDPAMRARYSFGVETHSDWTPGSSYTAGVPRVVDIAAGPGVFMFMLYVPLFWALSAGRSATYSAALIFWNGTNQLVVFAMLVGALAAIRNRSLSPTRNGVT